MFPYSREECSESFPIGRRADAGSSCPCSQRKFAGFNTCGSVLTGRGAVLRPDCNSIGWEVWRKGDWRERLYEEGMWGKFHDILSDESGAAMVIRREVIQYCSMRKQEQRNVRCTGHAPPGAEDYYPLELERVTFELLWTGPTETHHQRR